jgi:hypothetical protein
LPETRGNLSVLGPDIAEAPIGGVSGADFTATGKGSFAPPPAYAQSIERLKSDPGYRGIVPSGSTLSDQIGQLRMSGLQQQRRAIEREGPLAEQQARIMGNVGSIEEMRATPVNIPGVGPMSLGEVQQLQIARRGEQRLARAQEYLKGIAAQQAEIDTNPNFTPEERQARKEQLERNAWTQLGLEFPNLLKILEAQARAQAGMLEKQAEGRALGEALAGANQKNQKRP